MRKTMKPMAREKIIDVIRLRSRCAVRFLRTRSLIEEFSHKRKV